MPSVADIAAAVAPLGLDLVGAADVAAYDAGVPSAVALAARFPGVRTAVVIGHGGGGFWAGYRAFCERHPGHARQSDPLDAYTRRVVEAALAPLGGAGGRLVFPFEFATVPVSFMRLADVAGLGRPGRVGVLLHPLYGPWIALRAAWLVPEVLTAPRPADGFDPCPGCVERSCIAACPGDAVGEDGWNVPACAATRGRDDDPCAARCHARFECVLGRAHRYPADALAHHQGRARPPLLAHR